MLRIFIWESTDDREEEEEIWIKNIMKKINKKYERGNLLKYRKLRWMYIFSFSGKISYERLMTLSKCPINKYSLF